ncbi:MAG: transferase [Symploca sp. SIO2E6]|nr:transferase [Symploca sp. SIO2E6]
MHVPALPLTSNSHIYVEGDVSINPSAVIAQGVILQAAPDSKIIIAAGVSIGMGSILHAQGGTLEIEASANLGAGVLVVGKGKIGKSSCIGALTTIWNHSVEPWQVVPAASILGYRGRQIAEVSDSKASPSTSHSPANLPEQISASTTTTVQESLNVQITFPSEVAPAEKTDKESTTESNSVSQAELTPAEPSQSKSSPEVSPEVASPATENSKPLPGQGSLDQLLKTLFPYNQ